MCIECHQSPCASGCPNAPEPEVVTECSKCYQDIRDGEDYYHIDGYDYCEECVASGKKTAAKKGE